MNISEEKIKALFGNIKEVCVEVAKDAHIFIGSHELKSEFFLSSEYPAPSNSIFYDKKYFEEDKLEQVPYLKYRIPKYDLRRFPEDRKYYTAIFEGFRTENINLKNYKKIDEISDAINSDPEILSVFTDNDKLSENRIRIIVDEIVERYLYMTNATEVIPEDIEDKIKPFIIERLRFYFDDTLYFDICVPICLAKFEKDIKLDDGTEIIEIPEELQKSRQVECNYEVAQEDWVASCATHMIVLHNYSYKKNSEYTFNSVMRDYSCYPLDKIDEVIGIIRVATGYDIGYEQIFCRPEGWIYGSVADLPAIYGAKAHFVNPRFMKGNWMHLPVSYVTGTQCDAIKSLYEGFRQNDNKLRFPLMRFNRCMLRDEIDDMTTDACIGLESLLAGGTHSEITNAIASRVPFVLSRVNEAKHLAYNSRKCMRKIYALRSCIVHGSEVKEKDKYLNSGDERIFLPKMAVEYLRIGLIFMIENPKYIDSSEIDHFIDSLVINP